METKLNAVGELLATRRKNKGMTQAEAGAIMGVRKAMVSKIENGVSVNVGSIERLAEALGVEPVVELRSTVAPHKDLIDYTMTAIIEFSRYHNLSIREASNYLNRYKGIEFLSEFYDVEHTLSFHDCVEDLTLICQKNGGEIQF